MIAEAWTLHHLVRLRQRQPELVDRALQRMIEDNQDLAWSLAVSAYLDEEINLGKAAEILGMHELELRDKFIELGVPLRLGPATIAEAEAELQALNSWHSLQDNPPNHDPAA